MCCNLGGFWAVLQLFKFCEGLAFCRPMSARMFDVGRSESLAGNDLHASDGRDTEALNCKPITNL